MLTTYIQQDTYTGPVTLNPCWLRILSAVKYSGLSRSRLYELIAKGSRLITTNTAEAVELLAEEGEQRIPFDGDQVRSLIRHADNEWRGMILFGFHAGLRLSDCAGLTWANIDTVRHTVTFRAKKTAARKKSALSKLDSIL